MIQSYDASRLFDLYGMPMLGLWVNEGLSREPIKEVLWLSRVSGEFSGVGTVQPAEGLTGKKWFVGSLGVGTLLLLTMDITAPGFLTCELQSTQQWQLPGFIDFLTPTANHALVSLALSHISSPKGPPLAWTSPSSASQFSNEYSLPSPLLVLSGCWLEQYF